MIEDRLRITEALPEGDHHLWVTLSDGQTRLLNLRPLFDLSTHRALQLQQLARQPSAAADGQHIVWPGGALLDLASIAAAPLGPLPVQLDALVPEARRYRPVLPYLRALDPAPHPYLDIRPLDSLLPRLGLKHSDWNGIVARSHPAPPELVHARLSDLALLLTSLVADGLLPGVLRQKWQYALQRYPGRPQLHTADGCIRFGRFDLLEVPLVVLLLAPDVQVMKPQDSVGPVVHSPRETAQRSSASVECGERKAREQRGR